MTLHTPTTLAAPLTPHAPQRRMMLIETGVSTAINALIPAGVIWALALPAPRAVIGLGGVLHILAQATVLATFFMSLIVTALVRGRVAKGAPPLMRFAGFGWVPRLLPVRALFWVVCALVTVLPAGVLAAQVLHVGDMDRGRFFLFNVLFGAILGVGLTPFVVWLALTDAPRAGRR